jgi:conidiation protein 6
VIPFESYYESCADSHRTLKNPNVSEEAKESAKERLDAM